MTLVVPWLVFPAVLAALALGCGLLLERVGGVRIADPLVLPAGLAAVVVAAQLATISPRTAQLATPVVVALAAAGLVLSLPERARGVSPTTMVAPLVVLAVFAAPVVLSGQATFAGYIQLDDTATFLALTDRALEHGRSLAGLQPSSYEATLAVNLAHGYPLGSLLPLGIGHELVREDSAWLFQPYLAFLAAVLALALDALLAAAALSRLVRTVAVVVASQAALLYAYSLWGGIKELAAAALLATVAALAVPARPVAVLAFATACAALLGVLSLGGGVWLLPALVAFGITLARRRRPRDAAVFLGALAVFSLPPLLSGAEFLRGANVDSFTSGSELGNLIRPLSPLQTLGVWPAGDFRLTPADREPTGVLLVVVGAAALLGLVSAWRSRDRGLLVYAASAALGAFVFWLSASPWVAAKAFAIASPAPLAAAAAGCAAVAARGRRVEAGVAATAIVAGVLWSNVLAYRDVSLAPRGQLAELETIGERFAWQGPALMTEYQPYGVRHFLRNLDAEGASELRRRLVLLRGGGVLGKGEYADLDQLQLAGLLVYRTLVLRRSPAESRPPAPYQLVWSGPWYEVWQRPDPVAPEVLAHLPLGDVLQPAARPRCADVLRLGRFAGARGAELAAAPRAPAIVAAQVREPGTAVIVRVPAPGRYGVWLGGSVRRRVEAFVDGQQTGAARNQLDNAGQYIPLGSATLSPERHLVTLRFGGSSLAPGSGGPTPPAGPVVVERTGAPAVETVSAEDARTLCARRLDWIEVVR